MGFKLKLFLAFFGGFALAGIFYWFLMPIAKDKMQVEIENWYIKHEKGYEITATSAAEKKDDLLKIDWHGMMVTIAFQKPLADISWQKDSLQAYFRYISVDKIQNRIASAGWTVSPLLKVSSYSEGFIIESAEKDALNFTFSADIFAVRAENQNAKCKEQRNIADASLDEDCFIQVLKTIPFQLKMSATVAQ